MTAKRTVLSNAIGISLIVLTSLANVPCRLVAQTQDPETAARLREENAKLKQQLNSMRMDLENLRKEAMSSQQRGEALEKAKQRELEQYKRERIREKQDYLAQAKRELQLMSQRYTPEHPALLEKIAEVKQMQIVVDAMKMEFEPRLNSPGSGTGRAGVPPAPDQRARFQNQRELLLEEIKLAQQQAQLVDEDLKAGKAPHSDLLKAHRELLDLKLELAQLDASKTEQRAVLLQQLKICEQQLQDVKARIEAGTLPKSAALPFERELLRLKRSLNALE